MSDTSPDRQHAELIDDHPFTQSSDEHRALCARCDLGVAAHLYASPADFNHEVEPSGRLQDLVTPGAERFVISPPGVQVDMVNHPPHYTAHPSGVECITVVEHMNYNVGNAVKYLWRAGSKGNLLEDLKKARWYVDREIERLEKEC